MESQSASNVQLTEAGLIGQDVTRSQYLSAGERMWSLVHCQEGTEAMTSAMMVIHAGISQRSGDRVIPYSKQYNSPVLPECTPS